MKLLSLGIKGKLVFLIGSMLLAFTGAIVYALNGVNSLTTEITQTTTDTIPFILNVGDVRSNTHGVMRYIWRAVATGAGSEERKVSINKINEVKENLVRDMEEMDKFSSISDELKDLIISLNEDKKHFIPLLDQATAMLQSNEMKNNEIVQFIYKEVVPSATKITDLSIKFDNFSIKHSKFEADDSTLLSKRVTLNLILFSSAIGLFSLCFGFIFATRVANSLNKITSDVGNASSQVSSASEQLSRASEQLSASSQEQASALEQTSASLTEISSMSDANAKGAEQADVSVKEVYQISDETRKSMVELTSAMKLILESNVRIEKLVKVIEEIGEKTEVIDDIVFKTQLLSFNASVEAERAGEHGRGFAVVAQEVGNLAQVSGKAALEISSIVKTSIKEAEAVASENKMRVESGGVLAQDTKDRMEKVLTNLTGILERIDKIVLACREQKQGINQISTSIQSLSQATQETAGTAEEAASASVELSGQAVSLIGMVNDLGSIVSGKINSAVLSNKVESSATQSASNNIVSIKSKLAPAGASRNYNSVSSFKATGTDSVHEDSNGSWERL